MTPHDLLANFEVLAEAPNGIQRLRELVMELAVRGKLVEQDSRDEPAAGLLGRIKAEKARLVKEGKIRSGHALPSPPEACPFDIPSGWEPCRLAELGFFLGGKTPSTNVSAYWNGSIPWVSPKDMKVALIEDTEDHVSQLAVENGLPLIPKGSVLIVVRSGILRRMVPVAITVRDCTINQDLKALWPYPSVDPKYVALLIKGFESYILEHLTKTGTTVESMKFDEFATHRFPFPPLGEQARILARVDELMALLDRLDARRQGCNSARTAARDSALAALREAPTPEDVEAAWLRIQERFHDLFTIPEDIGPLRQTILQLAVRGALACQREIDGSAQVVLDHIGNEKARLIKSGKFRAEKVDLAIDPAECPFPLPNSWRWCRMRQLVGMITSGSRSWNAHYADAGASFIRSQDIKRDRLEYDDRAFVNPPDGAEGMRTRVEVGDLLVTITGANVGKCALISEEPGEAFVSQHVALIKLVSKEIGPFLHQWLTSDFAGRGYLLGTSYGAKPGLNLDSIRNLLVPMPPPPERDRILALLGQMLAKCDALLDSIKMSTELSSSFTSAVVHHLGI